tara:strand:+ start:642 stop:1127 length:486 start_codon:yes stop_codon:yes gene_type:complete
MNNSLHIREYIKKIRRIKPGNISTQILMSESTNHIPTEQSSPKSFGVVFSIVFLIVSLYPLINYEFLSIWALIVSVVFLLLAFIAPNTLSLPNKLWFKFGMLLGSIIAPIVMALVYFVTVLPTGLIMRLLDKDLLKQKIDKNAKSYWIERNEPMGSMKNQF